MVALDIVLLVALGLFVIEGFRKGIVVQLGGIAGIVVGIWLAFRYRHAVGAWLPIDPPIAGYVAFAGIVLVSILVLSGLGWLVGKLFHWVGLGALNRIGGALLALLKGVLILGIVLMALTAVNRHSRLIGQRQFEESFLYTPIVTVTDGVIPFVGRAMDNLDAGDE